MTAKANTTITSQSTYTLCAGVLQAWYASITDLPYVVASPERRQFDGS